MDDTVSGDSEVSTGDSDGDEGDDGSDMDEVLYQLLIHVDVALLCMHSNQHL